MPDDRIKSRNLHLSHGVQRRIGTRPHGVHQSPGILKFPSTHHAVLVRAPSNGNYEAEFWWHPNRDSNIRKRYFHSHALFGAIRRLQNDRWRFINLSRIVHIKGIENCARLR